MHVRDRPRRFDCVRLWTIVSAWQDDRINARYDRLRHPIRSSKVYWCTETIVKVSETIVKVSDTIVYDKRTHAMDFRSEPWFI